VRFVLVLITFTIGGIAFAFEGPSLLKSTETIVTKIFPKEVVAKAIKDEDFIKLRFDAEKPKGQDSVVILGGNHTIKVLLRNKVSKNTTLLVIAESLGGPLSPEGTLSPVILNSSVSDLKFLSVRLPLGEPCKNNQFLVTVFLKDGNKLYWNQRQAVSPIADCSGF